ncbi:MULTISPECIES: caspase family protein [Nostoc]|uniref:Caspase family protein n=2 Tax=Nostoc TaxID=1177 RepID=A0ABR8ICS9_9NOSO|nr:MULTISPECIES: caspase family protein [Nostoc]MBD2562718.1 caspase family protein [Nostoc linckia FACHB-391]MBD2648340.1 caspase family protein [Nostoc foliaceum FACHB-393]
MPKRKALIVGINTYKTSVNNLPSCVNDSNHFSNLLIDSYGFSDIRKLQDTDATLNHLLADLKWLFQDPNPDDHLVFYYSGHGYQTLKDGVLKECLVTSDEQFFFGDGLSQLTQSLPSGILSIVLDSCFSGGMDKAFFISQPGEEPAKIKSWFPPANELSKSLAAELDSNVDYQPFGQPVIQTLLSFRDLVESGTLKSLTLAKNDQQVNGLLMSACKADEKAAASTSQTLGLSAFTFGLLQSISSITTKISNNNLLNATKQKVQDIGLTQTPLLIEPVKPQGLGTLSFITFEPADKSFVVFSQPITSATQSFAVSLDKQDVYHKLTEGIGYPKAIGYSIKTLKELLSDLQAVNYQWLTYNSGEIGSWSADINGQQWGTTLCVIQPGADQAYPTIIEELSKAIQVAQQVDILINPYTSEAVEKLTLRLSEALSVSMKIFSMLTDI